MSLEANFKAICRLHSRVAIIGGPRTGKSKLAEHCPDNRCVMGTDKFIDLPWDDVPDAILKELDGVEIFLIEGVSAVRAMRRGLTVDAVVYLRQPKVPGITPRQIGMAKSVLKIFKDWRSVNMHIPIFSEELEAVKS